MIKYRTFTIDTKRRIKKADGYKITTCTDKLENGEFIVGIAICQAKNYERKKGQLIALGRMNSRKDNRFGFFKDDKMKDVLKVAIRHYIVRNFIKSLYNIIPEDIK